MLAVSDTLATGSCDTSTVRVMTTVKPKQTTDRYAILQRKFEDLERAHNDEKKSVGLRLAEYPLFILS